MEIILQWIGFLFLPNGIKKHKDGRQFTISGKYYYEDRRNGVEAYLKDSAYKKLRGSSEIYGESILTERVELFGTYDLPIAKGLKMDYSMSHHLQDSYYGADHYEAKQSIAFANLIWNKYRGRHDFTMGLTTRYQFYDDNTVATQKERQNGAVNHPDKPVYPRCIRTR